MVLLARLFPTARGSRPAAAPSRRRGPKARHRRGRSLAPLPSLATESLERRALLAVSATLAGGDLLITYNEPGDLLADISSDGTNYTVSGTGLKAAQFNVADVTGVIKVEDAAALGGQEFKVLTGTAALANPLEVNANVEATLLRGGITATKAGAVSINSSAITLANDISTAATNDTIAFGGAVTLANNTVIDAGAGTILFVGTVDGAFTLTANSTGSTKFFDDVGGKAPLVSLTTDAGVYTQLLSVTTTGTQTYNDDRAELEGTYTTTDSNFTVAKATIVVGNTVVSTGSGAIAFNGTVDGPSTLTANSTGATTFGGVVGGAWALVSLTTNAGGTVSLVSVTTTGTQTYDDDTVTLNGTYTTADGNFTVDKAVTLAGNTVVSTGTGAIAFGDTVDGAFTLTANSTGATTFGGAVGGAKALVSLATNAGGTALINGGAIKTSGAAGQVFGDAVKLGANTTLTAATGTIDFKQTLDGASTLTVADATDVFFRGKVGSTDPLAGITLQKANSVTSGDTISLDGTPALATNGITIAAGVNKLLLMKDGGTIENFSANGIWFQGGSTDSRISGFTIRANGGDGVRLDAGGYSGTTIAENSISDNDGNGVRLTSATGPVSIADNVKIDMNDLNGVYAENSTTVSITGNSISGNKNHGVWVLGGGGVIAGNGIAANGGNGVLLAGLYDVTDNLIDANDLNGIEVATGLSDLDITGNDITGNDVDGVRLGAGDYAGTVITANTISDNGDPATGEGNGILVEGSNLTIGWTAKAGEPNTVGNTITGNAANGIEIRGAAAQNNTILSNSIFENGSVAGGATVLGKGIALVDGGNGDQAAPVILRAVDDASSGVLRVLLTVPQDGDYYVQLFDNTPADEGGIFPADTGGFEGRTYVGDSPAQAGSAVTVGKPEIAGTLVTGNQLAVIEIPPDRVPAGNWITATATRVTGTTPGGTSPFSRGLQRQDAPVLAVGTVGQRTWSQEFTYSLLDQNQLRVTGLGPGFATALAGLVNTTIVITPAEAAAGGNVSRTVTSGQLVAGGSEVILNLTPGGALPAGGGTLVVGAATLPAAQLYDTSKAGSLVFAVGPVEIAAAIESAAVPAANANAFVNRYQGGLRVTSGDLDGDGFVDLVTAPGAAPETMAAAFGDAARVITIFNGNPAGGWESAAVNVAAVFGADYTGGFLIALGDVRPENAGAGSGVAELIVASTTMVAVFEVEVSARGALPVISPVPVATWTTAATVTGIAAGDFSADPQDLVVVATTTTNGAALPSADMATATVQTFAVAPGALVPQREFRITSEVQNGPPGSGSTQNVFLNGATLAVGDIDGELTNEAGQPRLKPELVLAAQAMGLGNFRALANELVAGGSQGDIDTALTDGNGFTVRSRNQYDANQVWQPAGGPDYFVGTAVPVPTAGGANAGLTVAVVDSDGRVDAASDLGRAEVFASLNALVTSQGKIVRRFSWFSANNSWQSTGDFSIGQSTVMTEDVGGVTLNAGAGPVSFTGGVDGAGHSGFVSLGRIMIEVSGLSSLSLSGGSQAQLNLVTNPQFNSIQTIAAAGYPSFVLPSVNLGGVPGTPAVSLPGAPGIGTVTDPGGLYQVAAQNAFENNPILAATFGRQGTAIFDQAASGTLPSTTPGVVDGFLFYDYVVGASSPVLPVGSDGPAVWVPHYDYRALSGNVLRLGGLTITQVNRLVAMRGRQIFVSADGRSEVATATVANVRRIGGRAVNMVLRNISSAGGSLVGTAGRIEPGPLTLPTARLYDAATGDVVLDVGAERITASLQAAGVAAAAADAFVSRFQGGLRVASGDVDVDGFADLVTAPGASPARPAATFGNATRIVTIYSGNPAAPWESASLDVSNVFPGYSGGFQVTLGDVLPEAAGADPVPELVVAGTGKVAVYQLAVAGPGSRPVIDPVPAAVWTISRRFRVTGLAAGDFSAAASDEVVLATTGPGGTALRTFTIDAGSFQASRSAFWIRSYVQADPRRRLRDVFAAGATLAVGDVDGAADGKPELVMAAANRGLANFRVLANDLVATGTQAEIYTALAVGNGFTQVSRPQYVAINGRRVWQPAGGPDYFAGIQRLPNAFARGINAPLFVAVVNADGRTAGGQVFAALGPQNTTSNMIRRLAWSSLEAAWNGTDAFQVQPSGRTRFPLGGGLRLG